jgi:HlyD family secretion protein
MITPNRIPRRILFLLLAAAIVASGCSKRTAEMRSSGKGERTRSAVTALGRVTPGRAAISISAPPETRLSKLEVSDGKKVRAGEVLAYLDIHALRAAERDAAQVALSEARERLETETAYADAVVNQSREAVRLLEITVAHQQNELRRIASLGKLTTKQSLDDGEFSVASREAELARARAEQRAAEAALARAVSLVAAKSAEARLRTAEAQLELSIVRAPIDGEVLKVFTYPGERIGNGPILKMGDTDDMHVIAEVHETDVGAVRVGQRATITSEALAGPVQGIVEEVGALIYKNDVIDIDPRAPNDTRVVEVRVKLEKSESVARLTHLEVSVRIELDETLATGTTTSAVR